MKRGLTGDALIIHQSVNRPAWHWLVNVMAASFLTRPARRSRIYRRCGMRVETDAIQPGCFFFGSRVSIGVETWVNHRCYFDTRAPIEIGQSCNIGMEVMFCTSSHRGGSRSRRAGAYFAEPIAVGDGTWIGTRAVLLPGVSVRSGCVIAAGAIVIEDCEEDGLYAGAPAKRIRDLGSGERVHRAQ